MGCKTSRAEIADQLAFSPRFELAPAAGPVVRDDLLEHGTERTRVQRLALAYANRTRRFVVVPGGNDPFGVWNNSPVVEEHIHVVPGRQQGADVAVQDEVRLDGAFDGLDYSRVRGVHQIADLLTDRLLPLGQNVDVRVDTRISHEGHATIPTRAFSTRDLQY